MIDPATRTRIIVGVDGSSASRDALRWALAEARLWHGRVEAVHTWSYPVMTYAPGIVPPPTFAREDLQAEARHVLDTTVDAVVGDAEPGLAMTRVVVEGSAAKQLIERSRHADMLVVGHRGHGGFAGLLLGSVAEQCAVHASCPTVVTRPTETAEANAPEGRPPRVVVGVDGSEPARRALHWAAEEAQRRDADLEVVHAWHPQLQPLGLVRPGVDRTSSEDYGKAVLDAAIRALGSRSLVVNPILIEGPSARGLVEVSAGAALLVVGSRGRGGFAGLLLGSVSSQVLHHARCPLVVVH
jgi:nucleotide-binding universal stress UspA family protein